jgi:hypothetical protein
VTADLDLTGEILAEEARLNDLELGKLALYQLSYVRAPESLIPEPYSCPLSRCLRARR